ncbi:MAG: hypothetical protein EOO42_02485 [Flavobacteriales bacterium]|nr:MAG: hypothetical protein EOO42_02485 [Flavobacteriales bacterium]
MIALRFFMIVGLFIVVKTSQAQFKVVGYIWSRANMVQELNEVNLDKITHLNIAFINPDSVTAAFASLPALDTVVQRAHSKNVKVLMSCGGGSPQRYYGKLLATKRTQLVNNLINFVDQYHLDGIDVDLEGDDIDSNYQNFITDLRGPLTTRNKLLTSAVAWWTRARITDVALSQFDFINIMAYDAAGPWDLGNPSQHSPYAYAAQHLDYWHNDRGMPKNKLVLGVPFYGYGFGYVFDNNIVPRQMNWKTVQQNYPGSVNHDQITFTSGGTFYYNGKNTIKSKTQLAAQDAGGIMIWHLLYDSPNEHSLLDVIHKTHHEAKQRSYGLWQFATDTVAFNYTLGSWIGTGSYYAPSTVAKSSLSNTGNAGFLPVPNVGNAKVSTAANAGAGITLANPEVTLGASNSGIPNKYSVYQVTGATAVSSFYFTLSFNGSSNGTAVVGFGNSAAGVFSNADQLTNVAQPGILGALRFTVGNNLTNSAVRTHTAGVYSYTTPTADLFPKIGDLDVEIYCNNTNSNRTYSRVGISYTLPGKSYHVFVNGNRLQVSSSPDIAGTGEATANTAINSLLFTGSSSTANTLNYTISNLKMAWMPQNQLPPLVAFNNNNMGIEASVKNIDKDLPVDGSFGGYIRSDKLILSYSSVEDGAGDIIVTDITGKKVAQQKAIIKSGSNHYEIDMAFAPTSVYVASMVRHHKISSVKIYKK